tara:strand:+ start:372 stop:1013 length:642 start_codon:yes stop_codon:yes gene_type:complete
MKLDLTIPSKKPDWKKKNNLYKKPAYSNPPRRPKSHANVNVSNIKKGVSKLDLDGNMYIPLSPTNDIGAWLGGSERRSQSDRNTFYSTINQEVKIRARNAGFKFKNIKFNYRQESHKRKWKEQHKFGPEERGGVFKSDIGRSLEFNVSDIKVNKSGSLTANINVGFKRGHVPVGQDGIFTPDPMFKNIHDQYRQVGLGPEHETVGTVGLKYKW